MTDARSTPASESLKAMVQRILLCVVKGDGLYNFGGHVRWGKIQQDINEAIDLSFQQRDSIVTGTANFTMCTAMANDPNHPGWRAAPPITQTPGELATSPKEDTLGIGVTGRRDGHDTDNDGQFGGAAYDISALRTQSDRTFLTTHSFHKQGSKDEH